MTLSEQDRRHWMPRGIQATLVVFLALFVSQASAQVTPVTITPGPAPGVTPATVSQTLKPGDTAAPITKTVQTPTIPPKPDIVFLADTTGSMGNAINNVKTNINTVTATVLAAQPSARFAVAQYKDVPDLTNCPADPFIFKLDQPLTASTAAVQGAVNTWSASGGCDLPEAQLYALHQLATSPAVGYRPDSSKVIVWFGDAPGHDPSNGVTQSQAIAALQAAGIRVIAISTGANQLNSSGQATAITSATGGSFIPGASDSQVANAILSGLQNLPTKVEPKLTACSPSLMVTFDAPSKTVPSGTSVTFTETIALAANAPQGTTVNCQVDFLINGALGTGFTETIAITVKDITPPKFTTCTVNPSSLWPPNHKMEDITATIVVDGTGSAATTVLTSVTSNEPDNGLGAGDTANDIQGWRLGTSSSTGAPDTTGQLRAERSGTGTGRVYTLTYTATDQGGNTAICVLTVKVPHDQGQ